MFTSLIVIGEPQLEESAGRMSQYTVQCHDTRKHKEFRPKDNLGAG